jgi:hypothetical protein
MPLSLLTNIVLKAIANLATLEGSTFAEIESYCNSNYDGTIDKKSLSRAIKAGVKARFIEKSGTSYKLGEKIERFEYRGIILKTGHLHLNKYLKAMNEAPKWRKWVDYLLEQDNIVVKSFSLTDVDFFGPIQPNRLGFFKGKCDAYDKRTNEKIVSNIVFGRGGCVACLVICTTVIDEVEKRLVVMTEQTRVPSGGVRIESMAGMLDASTGNFLGPVVNELEEELGIKINESDSRLKTLGEPAWPSPGGSDETIGFFSLDIKITSEEYTRMSTGTYGKKGEDYGIRIKFYDYDTFPTHFGKIGDMKTEVMWGRYHSV